MRFPDLESAYSDEITLEHASVLLERLENTMWVTYPGPRREFREICDNIDTQQMTEDLKSMFTGKAFATLFESELGKGIIIGSFVQEFIFGPDLEEEE